MSMPGTNVAPLSAAAVQTVDDEHMPLTVDVWTLHTDHLPRQQLIAALQHLQETTTC